MTREEFVVRTPETPEEWEKYHELCWEVMRRPWNQPRGSERDARENDSWHRAVYSGDKLVGIGRLQLNDPSEGQIRFMAVAPEYQGRGIGRIIIDALEEVAREQGIEVIRLDARENAVGFYLVLGYQVVGESKLLFGDIKHYLMEKVLYE